MASGSFEIDTFSWRQSLPLSTNTTAYSTCTTFITGSTGFLEPNSLYQFTTKSGFQDPSTLTQRFNTGLTSTYNAIGRTYISTVPTADWSSNAPSSLTYQFGIVTPNVALGPAMSALINSRLYNVFVDCQYSLRLATPTDASTWVSTVACFGPSPRPTDQFGRTTTARVSNNNYTQLRNTFMFQPQGTGQQYQIPANSSNFHLEIYCRSTIQSSGTTGPEFDVFVPGDNNFTFTLSPVTSTIGT